MKCRNCGINIDDTYLYLWHVGTRNLNNGGKEQFFRVRCPRCEKLWSCKRILTFSDMEIIGEIPEFEEE